MNTFKNWSKSSYYIYSIGVIILTILSLTTSEITVYSVVSLIGALFGFLSVVLIVNKNRSAGYAGTVSALVYMVVSWVSGNFSDSILNVLFLVFLNLPLIFNKDYTENKEPNSLKGNKFIVGLLIAVGVVVFSLLYIFEMDVMHAPRPEWSVMAATLGIVASVATSIFVVKESAYIWIVQNILQVGLWGVTYYQTNSDIALTMVVTYILYTVNSMCFFTKKWGYKINE